MCVIMIVDKVRPSEEMIQKALIKNPKGAGLAWREDGKVAFLKGLDDADEIQDLIKKLPMPFIFHARIETTGGISKELTHPFAVNPTAPNILKGSTKGYMLFHNGTWGGWKDKSLEAAIKSGTKIPGGRWSDSRAMAFVASLYGLGALEFIDEKSVVISPNDLQVYGSGWSRVENVVVSNRVWEDVKVFKPDVSNKSLVANIIDGNSSEKPRGASPSETFRTGNKDVSRKSTKSEKVEESSGGVLQSLTTEQETLDEKSYEMRELIRDGIKKLEWVRSLNSSRFRVPLLPDSTERDRRLENARNGITHLGKM